MANYAYKTILYRDTNNVAGLDVSTNNTNLSEYETNHQSSALQISTINFAETTFLIDKTYSEFDALIVSPYAWSDVKEVLTDQRYELYLITPEPL